MQPDETNIVDGPGLDEDHAKSNWLGKSLDDAFAMFSADWNHCYTEDFMYLSDVAVRYYLPAAIAYAASDRSIGDYLFMGFMGSALAFRLEEHSLLPETVELARKFAVVVLSSLAKYDLDREEPSLRSWVNQLDYIIGNNHRPRN